MCINEVNIEQAMHSFLGREQRCMAYFILGLDRLGKEWC